MSLRRLTLLLITIAILLAGCAGATSTAIIVPTASNVPTVAPAVTATVAPIAAGSALPAATTAPSAIATAAAHDLVPPDQINPQTQARLRLAYYVADGPNVDMILNGAIAVNGGQMQVNITPNYAPGYLYLPPGTYRVAVVPTGQGLAQALVPPLDVPVVAGHRYTLAVVGQASDKSPRAVVIDETAAAQKAGATASDSIRLWIDSLAGGTGIDIGGGGGAVTTHVDYGGYAVAAYPAGTHPFTVTLTGADSAYPGYNQNYNLPATSNIVGFVGTWGKNSDYTAGPPTSELNVIDYLQSYSGQSVDAENYNSFSTLLAAIQTAGLSDLLTKQGPHLFLAPNDNAFKRLPAQQLAALMADPKALADVLRNHIAAAYVPKGALAKTPGGPFARTFTNLLGAPLTIGDGYSVNGLDVGGDSVFLADGSQIHPIYQVLLPAADMTPTPAATQAVATTSVVTATASGRIAYAENTDGNSDSFQEIWIMNADGSGKTRLTNNGYYDAEPALSPDGTRIAYTSAKDGNNDVWVMNTDGSGATNLTKSRGDDGVPRWSPDGKKIVFGSDRDGDYEVYVMNADGSGQKRLTHNPGTDGFASFSPDGKRLAFGSVQGGVMGVYLMNADGSGQTLLTPVEDHTDGNGYPAWSPNGQQIAFATTTGARLEIYVIGVDGGGLTRLTNNPADDYLPAWSPDGTAIAFTAERDGSPQVYVMNADGSGQTRLTNSKYNAQWPSWAASAGK